MVIQTGDSGNAEKSNCVVDGISSKNRLVALLLSLFLGGISAHRFYVGKIGTGILQIVAISCFGLGGIWVLIDIIMIASGKFKDKDGLILETW